MNNLLKNIRIEYHILQSFPVTCLNRDDVGAPKSALIGATPRARVSSQCWKRSVRLALHDMGITLGVRTRKVAELIQAACIKFGANEEQAQKCSEFIAKELSDDTLTFLSNNEVDTFAEFAKECEFDASKIKIDQKLFSKVKKNNLKQAQHLEALDIALFGRMLAKAPSMNVEAATSFSHAISTHKVTNEIDYFTALDDKQEEQGAGHIGGLEFNSSTYYRYISLNLGQLVDTIAGDEQSIEVKQSIQKAVEAFTKALFVALPTARQHSQSGASSWEFAKILIRKGQGLQIPFETPIKAEQGGYLQPSINALKTYLENKEKLSGSLFGKIAELTWGEDITYSIDDVIGELKTTIGDCYES